MKIQLLRLTQSKHQQCNRIKQKAGLVRLFVFMEHYIGDKHGKLVRR